MWLLKLALKSTTRWYNHHKTGWIKVLLQTPTPRPSPKWLLKGVQGSFAVICFSFNSYTLYSILYIQWKLPQDHRDFLCTWQRQKCSCYHRVPVPPCFWFLASWPNYQLDSGSTAPASKVCSLTIPPCTREPRVSQHRYMQWPYVSFRWGFKEQAGITWSQHDNWSKSLLWWSVWAIK